MAEEPLYSLAVGFVAELTSKLKNTCGADDRHADAPSPAVDLAVTVLRGWLLGGERSVGGRLLPLGVYYGAVGDAVIGSIGTSHGSLTVCLRPVPKREETQTLKIVFRERKRRLCFVCERGREIGRVLGRAGGNRGTND